VYSSKPIIAKRSLKIKLIAFFDQEHRLEGREVQVVRRTLARHTEYSVEFAEKHTYGRTGGRFRHV
jgi:hypothetical protein